MNYTVRQGDSPTAIARKFGMPLGDLLAANPHKATTVVSGVRTWQSLAVGEVLSVPSGLGAAAAFAINAMNVDMNYCANVGRPGTPVNVAIHNFKQAWNAANPGEPLPVGTGKYEVTVAAALSSVVGRADPGAKAPAACDDRRREEIAATPITITADPPAVATSDQYTERTGLSDAALDPTVLFNLGAYITANPDQSECTPSAAVSAFQTNYITTYGGQHVYGGVMLASGLYDSITDKALWARYAGTRPPNVKVCTSGAAVASRPLVTSVSPELQRAAAVTLAAFDPCKQESVELVRSFQRATGQEPDGEYGTTTAAALAKYVPNAPTGCSPRPSWWPHHDGHRYPQFVLPTLPPPVVPAPPTQQVAAVAPPPPPVASPAAINQAGIVPPASKGDGDGKKEEGISTGALVAGGIGIVALIGIVAAATSGGGSREPIVRRVSPTTEKRRVRVRRVLPTESRRRRS